MKTYYITFELGEGIPNYDFVVKADTSNNAKNIAKEIIKKDYPMEWQTQKKDFSCNEITAQELLETLTLN